MQLPQSQIDSCMGDALAEARLAAERGEVPVGAIIWHPTSGIIARASNRVEELVDATAHAELLAIRAASAAVSNWRLGDCALFVTLEPCTMCIGALRNARVGTIVFGASDPRAGAVGSLYDLALDQRLGQVPRVISNVRSAECAKLLTDFFGSRR